MDEFQFGHSWFLEPAVSCSDGIVQVATGYKSLKFSKELPVRDNFMYINMKSTHRMEEHPKLIL